MLTETEAFLFVRKNSLQVANDIPENPVAQATAQFETRQQAAEDEKLRERLEWQRWLHSDAFDHTDDLSDFDTECKNLIEVWKDFQSRYPDLGTSTLLDNEIPNISTVKQAVNGVVGEWEAKKDKGMGKAKDYLTRYCDTLLAHSQLFAVIPKGDKYISLFTGVMASIVKAVGRHKEIAEGFCKALAEISDSMRFSRRQSLLYPSERMKMLVILLYIKYIRFLCHTMDWFSSKSKRFKSSLDQDYFRRNVQEKTKDIRDVVTKIQQEATLEFQGVVEATHSHVVDLPTSTQVGALASSMVDRISNIIKVSDQNRALSEQQLHSRLEVMSLKLGEVAQSAAIAAVERVLHAQELAGENKCRGLLENDSILAEKSLLSIEPGNNMSPSAPLAFRRGTRLHEGSSSSP
ncbi:hypothetical protein TruAng_007263 [Truncatella angustata]|nr:hypothetical protein TruAng_007263 [Truncatella angustata]